MFSQVCCPTKKNSLDEDLPLQKHISFFRFFVQVFFFARLSACSSFHLGFLSNLPKKKNHPNHPMLRPLSTPFFRQPIWVDIAERGFGMMIGVRSRLMVAINFLTIGALVREKYRSFWQLFILKYFIRFSKEATLPHCCWWWRDAK